MSSTLQVRSDTRQWGTLDLQAVTGVGRLSPRLLVNLAGRPVENARVLLADVTLRLEHRGEVIGQGRLVHAEVNFDGAQVLFEVPTSARLLQHVTSALTSTSTTIDLDAMLTGLGRSWLDPVVYDQPGRQRMSHDPEPGVWAEFAVATGYRGLLQIARGQWYDHVLAPTRNERYRYVELTLPRSDRAAGAEWAAAVGHLDNADRAYGLGDDPAVFVHLRGALDALPGAKQSILDGIRDVRKRQALNDLLARAGNFLHGGRHVAADGEQAGTFPVTHADAAFAVDLMRVVFSHLSMLLDLDGP